MTQAVYYIDANSVNPHDIIPIQAMPIVLENTLNKHTLLSALAKACHFPEYFANNWDSAFDCLTDSEIEYLSLDLGTVTAINSEDLKAFIQLIEDAYNDFSKPQLWLITATG